MDDAFDILLTTIWLLGCDMLVNLSRTANIWEIIIVQKLTLISAWRTILKSTYATKVHGPTRYNCMLKCYLSIQFMDCLLFRNACRRLIRLFFFTIDVPSLKREVMYGLGLSANILHSTGTLITTRYLAQVIYKQRKSIVAQINDHFLAHLSGDLQTHNPPGVNEGPTAN